MKVDGKGPQGPLTKNENKDSKGEASKANGGQIPSKKSSDPVSFRLSESLREIEKAAQTDSSALIDSHQSMSEEKVNLLLAQLDSGQGQALSISPKKIQASLDFLDKAFSEDTSAASRVFGDLDSQRIAQLLQDS
jgi:hypothetical protein